MADGAVTLTGTRFVANYASLGGGGLNSAAIEAGIDAGATVDF